MTVMKLLMPVAGLIKARSRDKADIDSAFFKLHYRTTSTILFICCILVTANNLIGKTIDCISDNIPGNVLNTYCWIMSTFSIASKFLHKLPHQLSFQKCKQTAVPLLFILQVATRQVKV